MNKKSKQLNLDFHKTIQDNAERDREHNENQLKDRVTQDVFRFNPRNYKNVNRNKEKVK